MLYYNMQGSVETINMNGGVFNNTSPVHVAADNEVNYY